MYKILVFFLLISGLGYSQAYKDSSRSPYPDTGRWVYFKLTDTISGEIIIHDKAIGACGGRAFASLSIIKTGNDTIRVLDLCDENNYIKGQKIKIGPFTRPVFDVALPLYYLDGHSNKKGQINVTEFYDEYDSTISRTTWGHITAQ